jgi:riboflavin synthase
VFTGIIETIGTVRDLRGKGGRSATIAVQPDAGAGEFGVSVGGSVALDGTCLTLESFRDNVLCFTAVAETLDRTTIGSLRPGSRVNMERALAMSGRLDGHFVLGHVDAVATIVSDRLVGDATVRTFRIPAELSPLVAEKGSVAIDGISLTVVSVAPDTFGVSLIPFTLEKTTLGSKRSGDKVNIECDVIARYLARLVSGGTANGLEGSLPQGKQDGLPWGKSSGTPKGVASGLFDKMERSGF